MYAGTVWLCRTEKEVWGMTPRYLFSLLNVHYDVLRQQAGKAPKRNTGTTGFIDQISGW